MIQKLMDLSSSPENGFFLASHSGLNARLRQRRARNRKAVLIGLTYALVDFANNYPGDYSPLIVIETGGMKGHRNGNHAEELPFIAVPGVWCGADPFRIWDDRIAVAGLVKRGRRFSTPPWMKVMIRDAK